MLIPDTKPRFRGCPPICETTNLPMHESEAALYAWTSKFCPGLRILRVYQCGTHWHTESVANAPSGESSGLGRYSKHQKKHKV